MQYLIWSAALAIVLAFVVYQDHGYLIVRAIQWILYVLLLPLSFSLSVRFDLLHLLIYGIPASIALYLTVHYCLRRRYSRLRRIPSKRPSLGVSHIACDEEDEHPDPLATFMSSIRIFGYLDPDVYAELQNSKTEERLECGERKTLDGCDFYVVIEGRVELRLPRVLPQSILTEALISLEGAAAVAAAEYDAGQTNPNDESVLAEVGPGGIASTLFDILSILTASEPTSQLVVRVCATEPTRLLRIPAETFKKIKADYPKASAHIVQVIMSRFQRVTFLTLNQYLGLTKESLGVELGLSSLAAEQSASSTTPAPANAAILPSLLDLSTLSEDALKEYKAKTLDYFLRLFSLNLDADTLASKDIIDLRRIPRGATLVRQGDRSPGLFILLQGRVAVIGAAKASPLRQEVKAQHLLTIGRPGSLIGSLSAFLGNTSMMTVMAEEDSLAAFIPRKQAEWLIDRFPDILFKTANLLLSKLSPTIRSVDLALDWKHLDGGDVLCRQGECATHIYIVIHGRIQCIQESGSEYQIIGEYGSGDSVGEAEMILGEGLPGTLVAMRDSEIACLPRVLFDALALIHPEVSLSVSRIIALKHREGATNLIGGDSLIPTPRIRNVAILPLDSSSHNLALLFAHRLRDELASMESVVLLDGTHVTEQLGKHAFSAFGKLKLTEWLNEIESENRIVLYLADALAQSKWTQRSIRQADCIFVVAHADANPEIGSFERVLLLSGAAGKPSMTRTELVLVHARPECPPNLTRRWLQGRIWLSAHHHVYMKNDADFLPSKSRDYSMLLDGLRQPHLWQLLRDQLEQYGIGELAAVRDFWLGRIHRTSLAGSLLAPSNDDFGRLARRLIGRSIGVVLGGGGARGLSHVGVIQALVEAAIPIDSIGGTSIGALMSALYSRDVDCYTATAFAKIFARRLASKWRQALDITYPITSWFTGHAFNRSLWKIFGDRHIEDLWLPFFCVTTDIAHSKMMVHRAGYVWRYVRASMSLSGFLPPLCDGGEYLLVDGGYMDNVPVDVMRCEPGIATVIAVDVGAADSNEITDYGDTLSGWWLLLQRWIGRKVKIPTLAEIQYRLAYVNCITKLEQVKAEAARGNRILYMRPPVEKYGVMDFGKHGELVRIGYEYGQRMVEEWRKDGTLSKLIGLASKAESPRLPGHSLGPPGQSDESPDTLQPPEEMIRAGAEIRQTPPRGRTHGRRQSM